MDDVLPGFRGSMDLDNQAKKKLCGMCGLITKNYDADYFGELECPRWRWFALVVYLIAEVEWRLRGFISLLMSI